MPPARAASPITRTIRPSCRLGAPRHLGAAVVPGHRQLREDDEVAAAPRRPRRSARTCVSRLCSTSRVPDVDLRRGDPAALHAQSSSERSRLARHDDDVVALLGRRDRPHDADDPVRLAQDHLGLAVGALEEVDAADRLAGRRRAGRGRRASRRARTPARAGSCRARSPSAAPARAARARRASRRSPSITPKRRSTFRRPLAASRWIAAVTCPPPPSSVLTTIFP